MAKVNNLIDHALVGTITRLSNGDTVLVEYMKFDEASEQNLLTVLNVGYVTESSVQDLTINALYIKVDDADKFRKDQTAWVQDGNNYYITNKPINKPHFKGDMQGLTRIGGDTVVVEAKIGNIEFNISEQQGEVSGNIVIFKNIPAMIYPGQYSVRIIEE